RPGGAVEQLPQFGDGGEPAVDGAERSEQLGQDGGGAAAVAAGVRVGQIPGESFGEHGGGLVGVGGAAVQVEVVHRVGVADAHDDVVGVGRAESGSRRADDHHGGPPGQRVQAQRLGDRAHHGAGDRKSVG